MRALLNEVKDAIDVKIIKPEAKIAKKDVINRFGLVTIELTVSLTPGRAFCNFFSIFGGSTLLLDAWSFNASTGTSFVILNEALNVANWLASKTIAKEISEFPILSGGALTATPNTPPIILSKPNSIKWPKNTPKAVPIIEIIRENTANKPIMCSFLIPNACITPMSRIISLIIWSKNIVKTTITVAKTNNETALPALFIALAFESINDADNDSLNKYDSRTLTPLSE